MPLLGTNLVSSPAKAPQEECCPNQKVEGQKAAFFYDADDIDIYTFRNSADYYGDADWGTISNRYQAGYYVSNDYFIYIDVMSSRTDVNLLDEFRLCFWMGTSLAGKTKTYANGKVGPKPGTYNIQVPSFYSYITGNYYNYTCYYFWAWYNGILPSQPTVVGYSTYADETYCEWIEWTCPFSSWGHKYGTSYSLFQNFNNFTVKIEDDDEGNMFVNVYLNEECNSGITIGKKTNYALNTTVVGQGYVTTSPACVYHSSGERVTLTPVPNNGNICFDGWTGDDASYIVDNGNGTYSITMLNRDMNITANFKTCTIEANENISICSDELPYTWNDITYPVGTTGTQTHDFTCKSIVSPATDSITHLTLTIRSSYTGENVITLPKQTLCQDELETFKWNGISVRTAFTGDTTLAYTTTVVGGTCDSITILPLTVNPAYREVVHVDTCEYYLTYNGGFTFYGQKINSREQNGLEVDIKTDKGCPNIKVLDLNVYNNDTIYDTVYVCKFPITWNGYTFNILAEAQAAEPLSAPSPNGHRMCFEMTKLLPVYNDPIIMPTEEQSTIGAYTWPGHEHLGVLTKSGLYGDTLLSKLGGCDSVYYSLDLTIICPPTTSDTFAFACKEFTWHGTTYKVSGNYPITLTNAAGCDSVRTLHLTIAPKATVMPTQTATICSDSPKDPIHLDGGDEGGDPQDAFAPIHRAAATSYVWEGHEHLGSLTEAGLYHDTVYSVLTGCDSVYYSLRLTMNYPTTDDTTAFACSEFMWNGNTYTSSGDYPIHLTNAAGCDSTRTLHLTIADPPTDMPIEYAAICAPSPAEPIHLDGGDEGGDPQDAFSPVHRAAPLSYIWEGHERLGSLTEAGMYYDTIRSVLTGCDSIRYTLQLTKNYPSTSETTVVECESYTWNGTTYTKSGEYKWTTTNAAGCDSVCLLHLTINTAYNLTDGTTICDSDLPYHWTGKDKNGEFDFLFEKAGVRTETLTSICSGCDSVVTFTLNVNPTYPDVQDGTTICDKDLPYHWTGTDGNGTFDEVFTSAGVRSKTLKTVHTACDSVVTFTLTVNETYNVSDGTTICNAALPYHWTGTDGNGTFDEVFAAAEVRTKTLKTIHTACDSVVTFTLTVNETYNVSDGITICDNELPYHWTGTDGNGTFDEVFAAAEVRTKTLKTIHTACDSVVTFTLTVNETYNVSDGITICDNELPYHWTGTDGNGTFDEVFTAADVRTKTLKTINTNCDSVVTFTLIVNPTYNLTDGAAICNAALPYHWTGTDGNGTFDEVFAAAEVRTKTLKTIHTACDSVVNFTLTVNETYNVSDGITICDNELPYHWAGTDGNGTFDEVFTSADVRTKTLKTVHTACDSVVTFTLTVNKSYPDVQDGMTICDSELPYHWTGTDGSGTFDEVFTEAEVRTKTLKTINTNCDSVVTFTLIVNPTYNLTDGATVCKGELPYHWTGTDGNGSFDEVFAAADVRTKTLKTINTNCDSVVTFTLTVKEPVALNDGATICDSELPYHWKGKDRNGDFDFLFEKAGVRTEIFTSISSGCDSTVTFTLTVNPTYTGIQDGTTICQNELPYTWETETFTAAGSKTLTLKTKHTDCDSTVTFTLVVNPTYNLTDSKTICPSSLPYIWEGEVFNSSGTKRKTLKTVNGCDSVVTFTLRVQQSQTIAIQDEVCDNKLPYRWTTYRTQELTASGEYTDILKSSLGCDSIIYNLTLSVNSDVVRGQASIATEVCADNEEVVISFTPDLGETEGYDLTFNEKALAAGFTNITNGVLTPTGENLISFAIPQGEDSTQYIRPDDYSVTLTVRDRCNHIADYPLSFRVLYPSWLIQQRWRDVLALYNTKYNGGYDFSLIRWFMNGVQIQGRGEHNSYIYTTPRLNETVYYAELTRKDDGKTIRTCDFVPNLNSPYYLPDGMKVRLIPRIENDMRHLTIETNSSGTYYIYDVTGKAVENGYFGEQYGTTTINFAPTAADGTYLIRFLTNEGEEEVKKWVVR